MMRNGPQRTVVFHAAEAKLRVVIAKAEHDVSVAVRGRHVVQKENGSGLDREGSEERYQ